MAGTGSRDLQDFWKKQVQEGSEAWLRMLRQGQIGDPQSFWRPFMEQGMAAWSKMAGEGAPSPDVMAQWKQFLDQWIAAWSKVFEQAMGTDAFAQMMGKQLETFLSAGGPVKKAAEQQVEAGLTALGLPSRGQVTALAAQIVQLEEKIEGLEDRLDEILKRLGQGAADARRERT